MSQGIPARDIIVDRNGQITTIWLIFFEQLYGLYSNTSQSNTESIAQIQKIADQALELAQQNKHGNDQQQKQIVSLAKSISELKDQNVSQDQINQLMHADEDLQHIDQQQQSAIDALSKSLQTLKKETGSQLEELEHEISILFRSSENNLSDAPEDDLIYGRKNAEWVEVVAVNLSLPFFLKNGIRQDVELSSDYQLPFFLADGTQQNIQMVTT
ncbi:hypothetical protein FW754_02785 [Acinetobacter sp. 1207_04]|uniref:hypothetical protein n=1 Tax=Acinetobacter sp. 1207_04 TaxID=2604449 RepID=UPI00405810B5